MRQVQYADGHQPEENVESVPPTMVSVQPKPVQVATESPPDTVESALPETLPGTPHAATAPADSEPASELASEEPASEEPAKSETVQTAPEVVPLTVVSNPPESVISDADAPASIAIPTQPDPNDVEEKPRPPPKRVKLRKRPKCNVLIVPSGDTLCKVNFAAIPPKKE